MLLAASLGVWLFYVQHQFEETSWDDERATGTCTTPRCTAARITTCRRCCAGSPPISACTTCIICAAAFPTTGCRGCCAIIPSSASIGRLTLLQSFALRAAGAVGRGAPATGVVPLAAPGPIDSDGSGRQNGPFSFTRSITACNCPIRLS